MEHKKFFFDCCSSTGGKYSDKQKDPDFFWAASLTGHFYRKCKFRCLLILFVIALFQMSGYSQPEQEILKKSTHYFILDKNDSLVGEGGVILTQKIKESQFFLIGETHDIQKIELFTKALIPLLKKNGFNQYVSEIGSVAAQTLEQMIRQKKSLGDFNERYSQYTQCSPFGFFDTNEEEETLHQLQHFDVSLSGIDFENYGSYLFLLDKIYLRSDKTKASLQHYTALRKTVISEYRKGTNGYNPQLANDLLASSSLMHFLANAENSRNCLMVEEFKNSLYINKEQTRGNWWQRVDNMKTNFISLYQTELSKQTKLPKMFFKLGAVHTARGTSSSGFQEVGNTIYELSKMNRTKSFSIIVFPRYVSDKGADSVSDIVEKEDKEILSYSMPDRWTFIDLRELFQSAIDCGIRLGDDISSYIERFDAVLIPPVTKYSTRNY